MIDITIDMMAMVYKMVMLISATLLIEIVVEKLNVLFGVTNQALSVANFLGWVDACVIWEVTKQSLSAADNSH